MIYVSPQGYLYVRVHGRGDTIIYAELRQALSEIQNVGGVIKLCKHLDHGAQLINLQGVKLEYDPCDVCRMR